MATIRDNVVFIKSSQIQSVEVVEGSVVASKGQPVSQDVTTKVAEGIATFKVMSGRKKSKDVSEKWKRKVGGKNNMLPSHWGKAGEPSELNFMFAVDVTWKDGNMSRIYLGQGSTGGGRNNWWVGSPDMRDNKINNLSVSPSHIKEDHEKVNDFIEGRIPPQIKPIYDFLGKTLLKEALKDVNVFQIER